MKWILALIILAAAAMIYIRIAPSNAADWHVAPVEVDPGDYPAPGGFAAVRMITGDPAEVLAQIDAIALATPRTQVLDGSVEEGMITYVTRSRIMGFPDYTTVQVAGAEAPRLAIHGRLRFGQSDLGVNRARVEGWLAQLPEGMIAAP